MLKELQSLSLSIKVFDYDGKEVDLQKSLKYYSGGLEFGEIEEEKEEIEEEKEEVEEEVLVNKTEEY